MKGTVAVFGRIGGRGVAAFLRDGQLDDLLIDPPAERIRPGAIFRARVGRPMKGQGGVICETPCGPLFLRDARGAGQGQTTLVQAITYSERGKATPATRRLVFKSRYCLVTPERPGLNISREIRDEARRAALGAMLSDLPETPGVVLRTAAGGGDDDAIRADVEAMLAAARAVLGEGGVGVPELLRDGPGAAELAWRDWPAPDVTDEGEAALERHGVTDMIDALRQPRTELTGGAAMFVEPTRALVAVDVNTGGDTSATAGLKASLAAARALPRALRLRGLGGQITVDFAPFPRRDRRQVEQALQAALRRDPVETSLVGWTPLGHLELARKRERLPLPEALP